MAERPRHHNLALANRFGLEAMVGYSTREDLAAFSHGQF
jgi:hypothetical protein